MPSPMTVARLIIRRALTRTMLSLPGNDKGGTQQQQQQDQSQGHVGNGSARSKYALRSSRDIWKQRVMTSLSGKPLTRAPPSWQSQR